MMDEAVALPFEDGEFEVIMDSQIGDRSP